MAADFLYIGAPRAGSTWLHKNLQQHPEIWVPPCKSILYFHPRFQIYRLKKFTYFWKDALRGDPHTQKWYRHYFTRPFVNDKWYQSLFPQNRVSGEIAEAYCSLNKEQVEHIQRMMPDAKILFVMRNPFERAISHAKLGLLQRKKRKIEDVQIEEFLAHINHPSSEARSFYSRTLDLWETFFPQEQFFIRFYEDLVADPVKFLLDICAFLAVSFPEERFKNTIQARVNLSGHKDVPEEVMHYTARKYESEISVLAERYGGAAHEWKSQVKEILS